MIICVRKVERQSPEIYAIDEIASVGSREIDRLKKIKNQNYFSQSLTGLLALRQAWGRELPKISRKENGRPYFNCQKVDFNISHSGSVAVAAVCRVGKVGVDVEKIDSRADRHRMIADRFFSKNEKKLLAVSEKQERSFFEIWTAKEAAAKCVGGGLSRALGKFDTVSSELVYNRFLIGIEGEEYLLTVCTELSEKIELVSDQDIIIDKI